MKWFLNLLLILSLAAKGQSADFIILKKGKNTVRNIYAGTNIQFVSTNGAYRDAMITEIKNDSIYLQEFLVRRALTIYGTYINDTAGSFRYTYHYNQIKSFGKKTKKGFNINGSGAALLGGGILLTLASGISYISDKEKFSPQLLGAAVGLGALGYLMSTNGRKGIIIGRKYTLQYMHMNKK
jgi:hypothetical protein